MCYSYLNSKTWAAQPTPAHKWRESLTEQSINVWARVSTQCLFLVFVLHLFVVLYYNVTGITVNVSYSYLWLIHVQLEDVSLKKPSSYWNETQCYVCFSSRDFWCLAFLFLPLHVELHWLSFLLMVNFLTNQQSTWGLPHCLHCFTCWLYFHNPSLIVQPNVQPWICPNPETHPWRACITRTRSTRMFLLTGTLHMNLNEKPTTKSTSHM